MKRLLFTSVLLVFASYLHAQVQPLMKDDKDSLFKYSMYDKTDFNLIDTLALWHYKFDDTKKSKPGDSIQVLGHITFSRIRSIHDDRYFRTYKRDWSPSITYYIYNLSDSVFCKKESFRTRLISSCVPPDVGGDYFIVGKYIFVNYNVCLNCSRIGTGVDYCRPVINYVISKIDNRKTATLKQIFKQFVIREG